MIDLSDFIQHLKSGIKNVNTDVPMSRHTSFRTGGNAEIIVFPENNEELLFAVSEAKKFNIPVTVMGNGSNLLIRDCGIKGLVIKTTGMNPAITVNDNVISCSAGTPLTKLCLTALENSLTGLEFAYGIPGTVGGAVFMNAGAYGGEIKDVITSATHITPNGKIQTVTAQSLDLSYRKSFYSSNTDFVITDAAFTLKKGDKTEIKSRMDELMGKRKDKQPLEFPSAGSTFKRPEGHFAGALIEQCNLKGYSVGDAEVSEKHAGFVINKGNATSTDILSLIEYVKQTVKENTGVILEPEVKIIP